MNKYYLPFITIIFLFLACTNKKEQDSENIKKLEAQTFTKDVVKLDQKLATDLINAYEKYAWDYPDDSLSSTFLFKGGEVAMSMNDGKKALLFFETFLKNFPDNPKAPHSLFLQGFVYENHLKDTATARKKYKYFLDKYPSHELAKDAKASIELLGKTPEEIIKMFEERQGKETKQNI